ncbi:MAG TPA: hypothetical protein VMU48_11480 [Terracidiphilus sp.]|nr:hypothetical protein [Terracidiphilus sp.]
MNAQQHMSPAERLRHMHDLLAKAYGPQHWWPGDTPFEVILGAFLTQNTSWKAAEKSLANLKAAGVVNFERLRTVSVADLQSLIRPSGFFTRKAPALKAFAHMLVAEFCGSLDTLASMGTRALRQKLLSLPGVGLETADAILLYALQHSVPVADEYLRRIVERHELLFPAPRRNRSGYESLVQLTQKAFAADPECRRIELYNEFHALTVAVGKAHCGRMPDCSGCPLAHDLSEYSGENSTPTGHRRQSRSVR